MYSNMNLEKKMSVSCGGSSGSTSFGSTSPTRTSGRRCKCGRLSVVYTSKTERNPNRAFFGCPNFKEEKPYCDYFRWVDAGNERMEMEECRINKVELDVGEIECMFKFKLKLYDEMQLNPYLDPVWKDSEDVNANVMEEILEHKTNKPWYYTFYGSVHSEERRALNLSLSTDSTTFD